MERRTWKLMRSGALLLIVLCVYFFSRGEQDARPPGDRGPKVEDQAPVERRSPAKDRTIVEDQSIRDESGEVAHKGDIDLTQTLERIDRGEKLRFRNDGTVFQNRERQLPKQASGYYHEWVHPTPSLSGPGPQRVITGQKGEAWYTPDHYRTFQRLR